MGLREDRLKLAALQGYARGWAGGVGDHRGVDEPTAVAGLRAISADPAVLTRAASFLVGADPGMDPHAAGAARLLEVAGADLDEAQRLRAGRRVGGWSPPQADPGRDRGR